MKNSSFRAERSPTRARPTFGAATLLAAALAIAGGVVPAASFAQNAAVVNGKPIPKAKVDEFMKALAAQGRPDNEETRKLVIDELVAREIFVQEADKRGLAREQDVKFQLENARQDILIRAMIKDHLTKNPVKDDELQAEYDKFKAQAAAGGKEYKARHILVESEDAAKKIVADLKNGAKFEELAKQSKDPGSGANGGDLGWNTAETFVPEFGKAMAALEKGKMTQEPVKTQFGWHVIQLDDVRDAAPPPLEQVKPQLQQQLERGRIQALQKKLRDAAKVE
ncbi:MAG: peptidylprolyl isomerase [Lautropia sp.]